LIEPQEGELMSGEWQDRDIRRMIANPYYCLRNWAPGQDIHEPMISENDWIKAAMRMIKEEGADVFLRHLLENLKGNHV
jgi:hypothetical protein